MVLILLLLLGLVGSTAGQGCAEQTTCDDCMAFNRGMCASCTIQGVDGGEEQFACFEMDKAVKPCGDICSRNQCNHGTCKLTNQQMYTVVLPSVLGGVLLIVICTIWCICRRCKACCGEYSQGRLRKKQAKHDKKMAIRVQTRKEDRDEKHAAIRGKYGLKKKADITTPLV